MNWDQRALLNYMIIQFYIQNLINQKWKINDKLQSLYDKIK